MPDPQQASSPSAESHQRFPSRSASDPAATRSFAVEIAQRLADDKCDEIALLDVRGMSSVSDYLVIASGTSDRQMRSSVDHLESFAASHNYGVIRRSQDDRTSWIVLDCIDVIIHIFEPNARAHYDLEMLWGDAPRIEWERPDQQNRDRAGLG